MDEQQQTEWTYKQGFGWVERAVEAQRILADEGEDPAEALHS